MKNNYEDIVMLHYSEVAKEEKDSCLSTMKDAYVRQSETEAIIATVETYMHSEMKTELSVLDIGCGNGYTLSILKEKFPNCKFAGIEKNDDLRRIANDRLNTCGISAFAGDVLESLEKLCDKANIVICQRVIINLLDEEDQKKAISNIMKMVKKDGILICIECIDKALDNLNLARKEFDLPPITASYHNLYLKEELFQYFNEGFERYDIAGVPKSNFLSTHYYISRVLHDLALQGKAFSRNSAFVNFFTQGLPFGIGDFSPIKLFVFKRVSDI